MLILQYIQSYMQSPKMCIKPTFPTTNHHERIVVTPVTTHLECHVSVSPTLDFPYQYSPRVSDQEGELESSSTSASMASFSSSAMCIPYFKLEIAMCFVPPLTSHSQD